MSWTYSGAREVINFLRELEPTEPGVVYDFVHISAEQGNEIARFIAARGGYDLFVELDERPGRFDGAYASHDWHWKLRQARNDGSNDFFDLLNGREPADA